MNTTLYDLDSLRHAQAILYQRTLMHYANSVLNRDISFDRAVKTLQLDTRAEIVHIEEDLVEAIRHICPTNEAGE